MKKLLTTVGAIAALTLASAHVSAQTDTAITLVHGIPGATVDVVVDGSTVVSGFEPGQTADLTTYAGDTLSNVEVVDAADPTNVIIGPVPSLDVPAAGNWSIVAMLDAGGTPRLASFENNTAAVDAGNARFTVRHTAAAPAVDMIIAGQRPVTGLTNGSSQELTLPVGTISGAQLALAGGDPIADIADIPLAADTNTVVYVVGSYDEAAPADNTIAFVTQNVALAAPAATTTVAGETTTTVAGSTTTSTTIEGATTTTSTTTTTTVAAVPTAINTGSPIDGNTTTIALIALGGVVIAGGSYLARRRV